MQVALGFSRIVIVMVICGLSQLSLRAAQDADELFKNQKWAEAARAYDQLTKASPNDSRAWYRLGYSLHLSGDYRRAVEAYLKSGALLSTPVGMYNLACSYARLGDRDRAFEWLDKAFRAGFPKAEQLDADDDLATLRPDARFPELRALATRLTAPCDAVPEYKQFDFWIGEWEVTNPQGRLAGTNSIQRILSGCIILENWTGSQGGTGKSMNFYNSNTGKWQQVWISGTGGVLELSGEYRDGAMRFEGKTMKKDQSQTLEKLTFFNLGRDEVRQLWEQSTDGGKTWSVAFDGRYRRKKASEK